MKIPNMPELAKVEYIVRISGDLFKQPSRSLSVRQYRPPFALDEMAIRFIIVAVPFIRLQVAELVTLI